ncbi:hypothetical protein [Streptomyces hilarionis]|uniref:hypothetical protein n=1 Tax=Streptomyces hilarionis TaxID=2839954 RepID=UPI00211A30D0|nr:hypothetical protein [Streptomyces hilarionis]MCQ9136473.1 hypothetical protein [Streptomyces hilarionis]
MGIRMLHRRKAHARVHATAAAGTRAEPGTAPWRRPRPALAPRAATPQAPRTPGTVPHTVARALRTAGAHLRRPDPAWLVPARLAPLVRRALPQGDVRRLWAEAVRGWPALALGVLEQVLGFLRFLGPRGIRRTRRIRRIPVFVATAPPLKHRPDRPAAP